MLNSPDTVVRYFNEVADLLTEYDEKTLDSDRLVLTVRNVTLGVQLAAKRDPQGYTPYLATSDTAEQTETGTGFNVTPHFSPQPANDAGTIAANIRSVLSEPDA
jgi:hypothetical protein